ncbi:acetylxylan esterase [Bacillaceae bacterium SIJ1]|uniref:alpha/beta fold hydrolase n=1 Tax=Litoribacterium kuwaitense TaxID=1398745 RepID=UPI0013EE26E9|nr:alpha/beta fold hydrolase [Litoribacterium kuwaitense]NGP45455.1 acetylxylan esterase [Litoribacterium kuwaitense]
MPMLDMPLEQLKGYDGRNPKPDDFADYWREALQELKAVKADIKMIPASFQVAGAECFHLYFTGVRGARVHAKYVRPIRRDVKHHPAVVLFHGYTGASGDWSDKLKYLSLGYAVFALDCRGQGGLSEDPGGVVGNTLQGHIIRGLDSSPHDLLFRHIFLDAVQLAQIAMAQEEVDEAQVYTKGASQGGGLALACAALEPRIKKVVSIYPFLCDYLRVWEMDQGENAYHEIKSYFRRFDPTHERHDEVFRTLGYIDVQHLADRVQGNVLMAVGLMDATCPPSTQFAAYNKLKASKDMVIYPDYGHESLLGFEDRALQFLQSQ